MRVFLCFAALAALFGSASAADLLLNGNFEAPSILGSGQTEVGLGQIKMTSEVSSYHEYPYGISGIQNWSYALDTLVGPYQDTDVGIANGIDFGDGDRSRKLMINRWNRRVVQSPDGVVIESGKRYTLRARSYMQIAQSTDQKVGVLTLFAGVVPSNASGSIGSASALGVSRMLSPAVSAGTDPNNHVVGNLGFVDHTIVYTATDSSAYLGQAISLSMYTGAGSVGRTYWDNVQLSVEAVPEPSTLAVLGLGAAALRRRKK